MFAHSDSKNTNLTRKILPALRGIRIKEPERLSERGEPVPRDCPVRNIIVYCLRAHIVYVLWVISVVVVVCRARKLAGLEDKKQAEELGKRAAEENWSVRRLEDTLRLLNANRSRKKTGDPYLRRMAGAFRSRLGARVAINGDQQKGKIVISYYSPEDLDAIYEAILGREEE